MTLLPVKTPPWKSEPNPLGPPVNPAAATPVNATGLTDLETRVETGLQAAAATVSLYQFNAQVGTAYTLALADLGKVLTFGNAALVTVTIPTHASVAFPTGWWCDVYCFSASGATFAPAGGVSVNTPDGVSGPGKSVWCRLACNATDSWLAMGLPWQAPGGVTPPVLT